MAGRMILYRGSLKSCNYHCSYCPFSKRRGTERELKQDRERWLSFAEDVVRKADRLGIRAVMAAPYGEALLHPWYWEGLARISACGKMDAVGAQTNLSFSAPEALQRFDACGGDRRKLRLWATFHPEMVTAEAFAGQCKRLLEEGILLCAGAVGVPEHIGILRELRKQLPEEIYMWINRMDGRKLPYTREEKNAFLEIDPYFLRELAPVLADADQCKDRLFVEGGRGLRTCNLSEVFDREPEAFGKMEHVPKQHCSRKRCSCYLAYGGRDDFMNRILFGEYPLFRIPRRPGAVFLDIEGTLLQKRGPGKETFLSEMVLAGLTALSLESIPLFFATTLPYPDARRRCREIWHLFSGGIFAGGAHLFFWKEHRELFSYLEEDCAAELARWKETLCFRMLTYRNRGRIYKITLCRTAHRPWRGEEVQRLAAAVPEISAGGVRCFAEGSCLQFVAAGADKAEGVRTFCRWMGISPEETAAAGDSAEDEEMLRLCGR